MFKSTPSLTIWSNFVMGGDGEKLKAWLKIIKLTVKKIKFIY